MTYVEDLKNENANLREQLAACKEALKKERIRAEELKGCQIPEGCVMALISHMKKKERVIVDMVVEYADQMENYSLGIIGDENDGTKSLYKTKLKESIAAYKEYKESAEEIRKIQEALEKYLKGVYRKGSIAAE